MAQCAQDSGNAEATARVSLRGTLQSQPVAQWCAANQRTIARMTLRVAAMTIPVVALDELADTAAGLRAGQQVGIAGRLIQHVWMVGNNQRTSLEVEAEAIDGEGG